MFRRVASGDPNRSALAGMPAWDFGIRVISFMWAVLVAYWAGLALWEGELELLSALEDADQDWMVWLVYAFGLFGTGVFVWRALLVGAFRPSAPAGDNELPLVTVVVPAYNEGRQVRETLLSLAASDYPADSMQILCVDDGSQDDTWQWMLEAKELLGRRLTLLRHAKNQGKRAALHTAFQQAAGEVWVTVDSDSLLLPNSLRNLVTPLVVDQRVGAVAGNVRVLNRNEGPIPRMMDVTFAYSFDFIRASQSQVNTVLCSPGALSAYRRGLLEPHLTDWLNQSFLGVPARIGEDRALTNLVLRQGYKVRFAPKAVVLTMVPTKYKGLCKMLLRWARSNLRESMVMWRFVWTDFRPEAKSGARLNMLLSWTELTLGQFAKLALFWAILNAPFAVMGNLLVGAVAASLVPAAVYYLRERDFGFLWALPYTLFWGLALAWIPIYAWFTMSRSGWLTRDLVPAKAAA